MEIKKIENKIKFFAINPIDGQEWYFDYFNLIKVIELCIENNIKILGLEGFFVEGKYKIPDMAAIFDNSNGSKLTLGDVNNIFFKNITNPEQKIWTIVYSL